ncbi:hypothetical protein NQZ68_015159 [Dissostichus eleginoides]|nr:hypothetical protein NQZ68_015159 [Dissostichus eleginoides]
MLAAALMTCSKEEYVSCLHIAANTLTATSQWHLPESALKYSSDWLKTVDPEILNLNTSSRINLRFDMDSIIRGS